MNLKAFLPIVLVLSASASASASASEPCQWPLSLDAVVAAPSNHKVLLENEHVRVLEVTVPAHSVEPLHAHCWPSTLYVQEMDDMVERDADGNIVFDTRKLPAKPRTPFVRWTAPQAPHAIENLSDVPLRLVRVESKR